MNSRKVHDWYIVVNAQEVILAVYGSALLGVAEGKARELATIGPVSLRRVSRANRPTVGAAWRGGRFESVPFERAP